MPLRGKKPKEHNLRLKALMYGKAGVGKTTAAIQMPKPYVIDTEDGSTHYGDLIEKSGGVVFQTNSAEEVLKEIRALATEDHDYLTLVIDPFTPLYDMLLDEGERAVGSDFGRHYGYANKQCKRLFNLLTALDMNIIMTAHSKNEYGDAMKVIGETFDGWKKLDYLFDLVFSLERREGGQRIATVRKTRIKEFEDQSKFEWSYGALVEKYGAEKLERKADKIPLATPEQVKTFEDLYGKLSDEDVKRLKIDQALGKVGGSPADLTQDAIEKGTTIIRNFLKAAA